MFDEQDIYEEFAHCPDYMTRLVYIKKNSKKINSGFIDKLTLHGKVFLDEGEVPLALELADLALSAATDIEDDRLKASSLIFKSQLLQIRNDYNEAEKLLFEAEKLYIKDRLDDKLCDIFNLLAYLYKSQKKYEPAIEFYKKAIELSQKINKKSLYALNLSAIGEIEYHRNRPQQSLWYFEQSLNIYREIDEVKSRSQILNWIGYININLKNYKEALGKFLEVLDILNDKKYEHNSSLAYAKFHLGTIYQHLNEPDKALSYLLEALKIWKKREELQVLSEMNFYWGKIYKSLNSNDKALYYFNQSMKLLNKVSSRKGSLSLLMQIKNLDTNEQQNESINSFFAKKLNVEPDEVDLAGDKYLFKLISTKYRDFNLVDAKNTYFKLATPSFSEKLNLEALKDNYRKHFAISHTHLSITFRQIAAIYNNKGMDSSSLPYIIELLEVKEKFYHSSLVKNMLDGLKDLSLQPEGEENYKYYLQEIIRLLKKFASNSDQALITYETGLLYFERDDYKKSCEILLKSLAIAENLKNRKIEARVCRAIAWCHYKDGLMGKTIDYLNRALKIDYGNNSREELLDLLLLGRFYLEKKDFVKAMDFQGEARNKRNKIISSINPFIALRNNLLESCTYFQIKAIIEKKFPPEAEGINVIFDQLEKETNKIDVNKFLSDVLPENDLWEFFSYQYVAIKSIHKANIYEATHFILKALKKLISLPIKENDKILLLRISLIYQTLEMGLENKWQLRIVDEYYREIIREKKVLSPFAHRAVVLFNVSVISAIRGHYTKAITALLEAKDIEQIEKNNYALARIYYQHGTIREYQNNIDGAIKNYNKCLEIYLSLDDDRAIGRTLNKLAILKEETRKDHLLNALAVIDRETEPLIYGQTVFNWATELRKDGDFLWESLDAYKEALKYFKITGFPQHTLRVLISLVSLSLDLGLEDMTTNFLEEGWLLLKKNLNETLWSKIRSMTNQKQDLKIELQALIFLYKTIFTGPSIPLYYSYNYWFSMELTKFFSFLKEYEEKDRYENYAFEIKREILDIWSYNEPLFQNEKYYDVKSLKSSSFDLLMYNENTILSGIDKKPEIKTLKNKILPLLQYLVNTKENESLTKKYISDIIADMEKYKNP